MQQSHGLGWVLLLSLCAGTALAQPGSRGKPKATVRLVSSVNAVAPGATFELGLAFKLEDHWHIYWQNPGEAGMAPKVAWDTPDGIAVGDLRFPMPKRHTDPSGVITSNVIEGEPVLLANVQTSDKLKGDSLTLRGDLTYLVCRESCIQQKAKVELTLPVRPTAEEVQPAHAALFERARRALPKTQSKYLTVTPTLSEVPLTPGKEFEFRLELAVKPGFHIQSHQPTNPLFVRTDVFMERVPGIYWADTHYPEPHLREDKIFGKLSEFSGKNTVRVEGVVEEDPPPPSARIAGILHFQACDEKGMCFPPESLAFALLASGQAAAEPVDVAPETAGTSGTVAVTPPGGSINADPKPPVAAESPPADDPTPQTLLGLLGFAFLGGLILNIMPCVLPVISIKILSFVQQSGEESGRVFRLGLTFAAGILFSFWALAITIIALKSAGQQVGWGFQLANPTVVIVTMSIIFVFGLSLLGVFTITLPGAAVTKLASTEEREGYFGAFTKGVLGTVLATPCTAPFLGPALGVAFATTNAKLFAIFTAVGLGMASPFILLTWNPRLLRFLPRPGAWMEHFKQLMGFLLMGTVVWMMFVLGHQIGSDGVVWTIAFLGFLAVAVWVLGLQSPLTPVGRRVAAWAVAVGMVLFGWNWVYGVGIQKLRDDYLASIECPCDLEAPEIASEDWEKGKIPWQPWFKGRAENLAAQGYTVYVDYTAVWCATCLANKAATLETDEVREVMRSHCVIPLKADFTNMPEDMFEDLQKFERAGVPLNVIYPAGRPEKPILMPEQLVGRTGLVIEKLNEAGPSLACKNTAVPGPTTASLH